MRLVAENFTYKYPRGKSEVLKSFSFHFEPGSYWCLTGPNGSGKSTFLKACCGLIDLSSATGTLKWNDREISHWSRLDLAKKVAFVPSQLNANFALELIEFVTHGRFPHSPGVQKLSEKDFDLANDALKRIKIDHLANRSIDQLSLGESQLALIARAIVQNPEVLILDEATSNLDLHHQHQIFDLLGELNKNNGMTLLLVSHDINLAAEFCPNLMIMNQGAVAAAGPMGETLNAAAIRSVYSLGEEIDVGKNPFTQKPKLFWR